MEVDVVAGAEGFAAGVEGVEEGHDDLLVRHCDDAAGEVGAAECVVREVREGVSRSLNVQEREYCGDGLMEGGAMEWVMPWPAR